MHTIINYWAVLAAALASMIIGSMWYGPLFGKRFRNEMGMDKLSPEEQTKLKKTMARSYVLQFIGSLVMFFILAWYITTGVKPGLAGAFGNAFALWIGFVVPLALGNTIWGGKWSLFWMNIGNMFITLMVAGFIIGVWH